MSIWLLRFSVLALASLAACVRPSPVIRLHPTGTAPVWVNGLAVKAVESPTMRVAAAFVEQREDFMVFRVELQNLGEDVVLVDPSESIYRACRSSPGSRAPACSRDWRVPDPEKKLLTLDRVSSRERASHATSQGVYGPLLLLSAVADVSAAASGQSHSGSSDVSHDLDSEEARHSRTMSALERSRHMWAIEALRKTTLSPGGTVAGHLYVPVNAGADRLELDVYAAGMRFRFPFRQTLHRP